MELSPDYSNLHNRHESRTALIQELKEELVPLLAEKRSLDNRIASVEDKASRVDLGTSRVEIDILDDKWKELNQDRDQIVEKIQEIQAKIDALSQEDKDDI
jgi:chromosome segregation ATPase